MSSLKNKTKSFWDGGQLDSDRSNLGGALASNDLGTLIEKHADCYGSTQWLLTILQGKFKDYVVFEVLFGRLCTKSTKSTNLKVIYDQKQIVFVIFFHEYDKNLVHRV